MDKPKDRRVERTRNLIRAAFFELAQEKGYSAVTVQNIIDRANVGRSTFYAHFLDKEQLLLNEFREFQDFLRRQRDSRTMARQDPGAPLLGFSMALFEHAQENYLHFQALYTKQDTTFMHQQMQRILAELVQEELEAIPRDAPPPLPLNALAQFIVHAYWALLVWWVERGMPYPAEEMDRLTHDLITSGVAGMLTPRDRDTDL
ncbi:MAG: TetR/AcrR family transcriptional regulator [Bacilli bacterium]